jgi:hypothetical protein
MIKGKRTDNSMTKRKRTDVKEPIVRLFVSSLLAAIELSVLFLFAIELSVLFLLGIEVLFLLAIELSVRFLLAIELSVLFPLTRKRTDNSMAAKRELTKRRTMGSLTLHSKLII